MPKIALKEHIGELVEIEFNDHAFGVDQNLIQARVWGRLFSVTPVKAVMQVWETLNYEDNDEYAVILRDSITACHRLRRVK